MSDTDFDPRDKRAVSLSYDWMGLRYHVWIANAPYFGWSIMCDYGKPENEYVVTSPHTVEQSIVQIQRYFQYDYPGTNFSVEEWEEV